MKSSSLNLNIRFDQLLDLFRQLPLKDKLRLSRELEKDAVDVQLSRILRTFKTDELSDSMINAAVEKARTEIYARSKRN